MFDIGWQELFIVATLALIVVGPKELPRAIRNITGLLRKARLMARDFQEGIDDVVREADLNEIKENFETLADGDIDQKISNANDPISGLTSNLELIEAEQELSEVSKKKEPGVEDAITPAPSHVETSEEEDPSQADSVKDK